MTVASFSRFFATLALLTAAATAAVWILAWLAHVRPVGSLAQRFTEVRQLSLWLAFVVASVTMAGSLYYSLSAGFEPCELCWYQRICLYPLSLVLLVAAIRKDFMIWRYTIGIAAIGMVIAAYHTQLQAYPKQQSFCSTTTPCTARYVWEFGFVSLPLMNLVALTFITTMLLIARRFPMLEDT